MDRVIILRYSEIHLKGKNRIFFENILKRNIHEKLRGITCKAEFGYSRYIISDYSEDDETKLIEKLKTVFGLYSLSPGLRTSSDIEAVGDAAEILCPKEGTFRITVNRADKTLPYTSVQLAASIGGRLLDKFNALNVDLHNPDFIIYVDARDRATAYVYSESILCAGGMPVGSAGKGLSLLSGGIDSPVSTYMMAKRGLELTELHFWSYPYTSLEAKDKVIELAHILRKFTGDTRLIIIPFTEIQEAVHKFAEPNYMITLVRRAMMRIAERIAEKYGCGCIINGEDLGQVASQTLESITVTNSVVKNLPVFRPLIGFDKNEIIEISKKIGTYETSIKPYEDCCTVFLPESPATKPTIRRSEASESKIENYESLISKAVDNAEVIVISDD